MKVKRLINGLRVLIKYNPNLGVSFEYEYMCIEGIEKEDISDDDIAKLTDLGFEWDYENDCFNFG